MEERRYMRVYKHRGQAQPASPTRSGWDKNLLSAAAAVVSRFMRRCVPTVLAVTCTLCALMNLAVFRRSIGIRNWSVRSMPQLEAVAPQSSPSVVLLVALEEGYPGKMALREWADFAAATTTIDSRGRRRNSVHTR